MISARIALTATADERDARHARKPLVQHRELDVLRPEIVAPLRDAVGFVDGEQRQPGAAQQLEEARRQQALGRDVQQVEPAAREVALGLRRRLRVERGVEHRRFHPGLEERRDLVLHQRDQRRHHHRAALAHQRGYLVAQRLAAAGRHQHQRVAARRDVLDDFRLRPAKRGEAEQGVQELERGGHTAGGLAVEARLYWLK